MMRTVTFRLTLLYFLLYAVLSTGVFFIVQNRLSTSYMARVDNELDAYVTELAHVIEADSGMREFRRKVVREMGSQGARSNTFLMVLTEYDEGTPEAIFSSDMDEWSEISRLRSDHEVPPEGETRYRTIPLADRGCPARVIYRGVESDRVLVVGVLLDDYAALMSDYRRIFVSAAIIALSIGGLLGYVVSRHAMSGVIRVTKTAKKIDGSDLHVRVPLGREGQEIEQLASAFNEMLSRIETLVTEMKTVTDNIAHDLRSPVTRIRGIAEAAALDVGEGESSASTAGRIVEECDRLVTMINVMLEISRTDAGMAGRDKSSSDMVELVKSACELFEPAAFDSGIGLTFRSGEEQLIVYGDVSGLQHMIANLIDNAVKFTPSGGKIDISAGEKHGMVTVEVSDTGEGISPTDISRIFERFYRADASRTRPGNGLGLSLARSVVRAHGGDITVSSSPGHGSTFIVSIPRAPETS